MQVTQVTQTARKYLVDLFEGEEIINVGLEEVVFDEASHSWRITIGFSRPWERNGVTGPLVAALGDRRPPRTYKVIRVNDYDGSLVSMMDRVLPAAE